jgi:hypothetical protein
MGPVGRKGWPEHLPKSARTPDASTGVLTDLHSRVHRLRTMLTKSTYTLPGTLSHSPRSPTIYNLPPPHSSLFLTFPLLYTTPTGSARQTRRASDSRPTMSESLSFGRLSGRAKIKRMPARRENSRFFPPSPSLILAALTEHSVASLVSEAGRHNSLHERWSIQS